ncbi:MAG TPA: phytanoyl-CoA dioxygenase family protein [Acidimicrobiales bacterium]
MTVSTLPPLDDAHRLDGELVSQFAERGHALVAGLASRDEVNAYRPLIERAALDTAWDTRPIEERDTYGKAFLQSFNLWRVDPGIARFVLSRRFADVAARLLGVERVRLYHDQALCKEPGGGRTPWHQDQYYWPIDTDRTITMWMPLVDVPGDVGSMTFATGSHVLGDLRGHSISDESDSTFGELIAARAIPTHTYGAMRAGDATFHAGWTIHSAGPNPTDLLRTVMTIIYLADGAHVPTELTEAQDFDRRAWLGGTESGEPIASDLNPLLG